MDYAWILGAGHFGSLAAERISKRHPGKSILVVDEDYEKLKELESLPVTLKERDALEFLSENFSDHPKWIVPAVPVHVAFEWLVEEMKKNDINVFRINVPPEADEQVPNPYRMTEKTLYASFADFVCPDNCSEPENICTKTKQPRKGNLFEVLGKIKLPGFHVVVLRSHQLAPGVGGYTPEAMKDLYECVVSMPGKYLVATSCRCHGVIDALEWK